MVGERAGYELRSLGAGLHAGPSRELLAAGRWTPTLAAVAPAGPGRGEPADPPAGAPRVAIALERVTRFGPEIVPIVEMAKEHAILTTRDPARLNAFLDFPRQSMSGWHLLDGSGKIRGLAVLNLIPKDGGRTAHWQGRRLPARRR